MQWTKVMNSLEGFPFLYFGCLLLCICLDPYVLFSAVYDLLLQLLA